jgi:hypothetical protein
MKCQQNPVPNDNGRKWPGALLPPAHLPSQPFTGSLAVMRNAPLALYLDALRPALPSGLFPAGNLDRMKQAVDGIPAALVSLFGFECRLGDTVSDADILFAANVEKGGRAILTGTNPLVQSPVALSSLPVWPLVAAFCQRWADPSSSLYYGADDVWFEFDIGASANTAALIPSFFFGPRVAHLANEVGTAARHTMTILSEGFNALTGKPLPVSTTACLEECMAILPSRARVFQAGLMLSRPDQQIRICLDNLSASEILRLITHMRNETEAAGIAAAIANVEAHVVSIKLAVDVDAHIGPRIGLECYAVAPQNAAEPARWTSLLAKLVESGSCLSSKRDALLGLPTVVSANDTAGPWPEDMAEFSALLGRELAFSVWLHHLKLTCEAGQPTQAKAYIAVGKRWLA